MSEGLLAALLVNLLAEVGDKTQLAVFALSARYRKPYHVFGGAVLGSVLATVIGITVGAYVTRIVPLSIIKTMSGFSFLALGAYILIKARQKDVDQQFNLASHKRAFVTSLGIIFFAEMGDKSQVANLLLATRYDFMSVLIGSAIGVSVLAGIGTVLGHKLAKSAWAPRIRMAAGLLFIALGLAALFVV